MTCVGASLRFTAPMTKRRAILAGDSLLTFAFDLVSGRDNGLPGDIRAELANRLARAAGFGGMAGGQALDLAAAEQKPDADGIVTLQAMKNGRADPVCLRGRGAGRRRRR
jgi:geranylgeranyl pyrophosphate synthase